MTDAAQLGEMTLSMLRGEEGRQAKELERLVSWLTSIDRPDVVHISNALLLGIAGRIKQELRVPVVCSLQDEDIWLDALPDYHREVVWGTLSQRAADVDAFVSVSKYYKEFMCDRAGIPTDRIHVVYNGIDLEGHEQADVPVTPPGYVVGQFMLTMGRPAHTEVDQVCTQTPSCLTGVT